MQVYKDLVVYEHCPKNLVQFIIDKALCDYVSLQVEPCDICGVCYAIVIVTCSKCHITCDFVEKSMNLLSFYCPWSFCLQHFADPCINSFFILHPKWYALYRTFMENNVLYFEFAHHFTIKQSLIHLQKPKEELGLYCYMQKDEG